MKFILGVIFAAFFGSVVAIFAKSAFSPAPESVAEKVEEAGAGVPTVNPDKPSVPSPVYSGPGFVASALPENVVWVNGVMIRGRKVWAYLSDGRVFREDTKDLNLVDGQGLVLGGKINDRGKLEGGDRIWMRPIGLNRINAQFSKERQPDPVAIPAPPEAKQSSVEPSGWVMGSDGVLRSPRSSSGIGR
jgi:hypothetical protein